MSFAPLTQIVGLRFEPQEARARPGQLVSMRGAVHWPAAWLGCAWVETSIGADWTVALRHPAAQREAAARAGAFWLLGTTATWEPSRVRYESNVVASTFDLNARGIALSVRAGEVVEVDFRLVKPAVGTVDAILRFGMTGRVAVER